jgi:hypothetical protein
MRLTLDDDGNVLGRVTYDPFGQVERGTTLGFACNR